MPILGIIASQDYNRVTNSYESIASTTVGSGGSATITFSSIPATYTHLQIRYLAANEGSAATDEPVYMRFNSDTTNANYRNHRTNGDGSSVGSGSFQLPISSTTNGNGNAATYYSGGVIDVLDYANTNKYATVRSLSGWDSNGAGQIWLMSELWMNTAAITRIDFTTFTGSDYREFSKFALYGIKGA
jgi:hypothetical protein